MQPFTDQITIEKYVTGKNSIGTPTQTWDELCVVRAAIKQGSGNKSYDSDPQMNIHAYPTTFFTRFIEGLNYKCRVRYNTEVFEISAINLVRRRSGHEIITLRKQSDGR